MHYLTMLLAATIYLEAGNQGPHGMELVADVINNRAYSLSTEGMNVEDRYIAVILEPKQFSCWNNKFPTYQYLKRLENSGALGDASIIADKWKILLAQTLLRPFADVKLPGGSYSRVKQYPNRLTPATSYHTINVYPSWANRMKVVDAYRDHVFYVDK